LAGVDPVSARRRAHAARRRAIHAFALGLARHPRLIAHARRLAAPRRHRVARIAVLLAFVHRLAAADAGRGVALTPPAAAALRGGDLAAIVLWALLRAAGERASVDYTRETAFVRVAVSRADVRLLPPWARLMRSRTGALEIGLAPAASWRPAGYLPPDVRAALQRRRPPLAIAS
jgi:hypothetical protein